MDKIVYYFLIFMIYAFLGYICEVVYVAILTKKIINRGYLYGPLVPIYAFGALLIVIPFTEFEFGKFIADRWYLVVLVGYFVPTILEYLTSYFMEKIFHMRWWDYSERFLNINGRVCLRNSVLFTILVVFVVYLINPLLDKAITGILDITVLAYILAGLLFILISVDFVFSTIKHINISKIIVKLNELKDKADVAKKEFDAKREEAKNEFNKYLESVKEKVTKISAKYPTFEVIKNKNRISLKELINRSRNKSEE